MNRPRYPLTGARPVFSGEDESPRDGFQAYVCCYRETAGVAFDSIWARSVDEARRTWWDHHAGTGGFLYDVVPSVEFGKQSARKVFDNTCAA